MLKHLHEYSDEALVEELNQRAKQQRAAGVVAAGAIPPFILPLLKRFAGPALVAAVCGLVLDEQLPKGGGKALEIGHVLPLGEGNSRGGHFAYQAVKQGDRQ